MASSRWDVERATFRSNLPSPARLILAFLLSMTEADTAVIPEKFSPSLSKLAEATGYDRRTVMRQLNELEELGWVKRGRPSVAAARSTKERTSYALAVGHNAPDKPKKARGTVPLGAQDPQTNQDSMPEARGTEPLELGAQDPQSERGARGTVPHIPDQDLLPDLPTSSGAKSRRPRKPKTGNDDNAGAVVKAYIDGAVAAGRGRPAGYLPKKIGKDAKDLLADGVPIDKLIDAAKALGAAGWKDLALQLLRMGAERNGRSPRHQPYTDGSREDLSRYAGLTKGNPA